jgi:hypothetical protein
MDDRTIIMTFTNEAWTAPGSLLDLFLQSFRLGVRTAPLLKHLIVVAVDAMAYERCQHVHRLCYHLRVDGVDYAAEQSYMQKDYLDMMWRRNRFQARILELGYSFVFTVSSTGCRGPIRAERSAAARTDWTRACMLMNAGISITNVRRMWTSSGCGTRCCASR